MNFKRAKQERFEQLRENTILKISERAKAEQKLPKSTQTKLQFAAVPRESLKTIETQQKNVDQDKLLDKKSTKKAVTKAKDDD